MRYTVKELIKASKEGREIWRRVAEIPFNRYFKVSNLGRVKVLDRVVQRSNGKPLPLKGKIVKQHIDVDGYHIVHLQIDSKSIRRSVHRLMLAAFIGEAPADKPLTRHLDGDPSNNKLYNIRYGNNTENQRDRVAHGTASQGEKHPLAILTEKQVLKIQKLGVLPEGKQRVRKGFLQEMADLYGVSKSTIHNIIKKRSWKTVGVSE